MQSCSKGFALTECFLLVQFLAQETGRKQKKRKKPIEPEPEVCWRTLPQVLGLPSSDGVRTGVRSGGMGGQGNWAVNIQLILTRGVIGGSGFRTTCCFCCGQFILSSSKQPVTAAPEDLGLASGLCSHLHVHICKTYTSKFKESS